MSDSTESRPLGLTSLSLLVVASMIGAGVYTTSGYALADLRDPRLVLLAWLAGGAIALCGAHSYALLARRLQESGGEYVYLARGLHPAAGFLGGWVSLLAGFSGAAAFAAVAFEEYALPETIAPNWLPPKSLASLLVVVCTATHAWRTRTGAIGQNLLVVVKLGFLAVFIAVAVGKLGSWSGNSLLPPTGDGQAPNLLLAFASSVMWISLSYSGFNAAVYVAEEARGGGRTVAKAMQLATLSVTIIYLALNTIFLFGPPAAEIAGQPDVAAIAARFLAGSWFAWFTRLVISLSLASSVSACLLAGPRVYAKMAADGLLPATLVANQTTPTRAVLLQGGLILCIIQVATLQNLLSYLGMTLSLFAALTVSTLFRTGRASSEVAAQREMPRPSAIALIVPGIYVVATICLALLSGYTRSYEALGTLLTLLSGLLLYWLISRRNR